MSILGRLQGIAPKDDRNAIGFKNPNGPSPRGKAGSIAGDSPLFSANCGILGAFHKIPWSNRRLIFRRLGRRLCLGPGLADQEIDQPKSKKMKGK
jgi:hypothetical protein